MAEQIVVDGEIVDVADGLVPDEDQSLLDTNDLVPEEPKEEDFESNEEFTAALEKHKTETTPEPWLQTDELGDVPVKTHIRVKQKLKGQINERDEENEKLKHRITELEASKPAVLSRPNVDDYEDEDDEKYKAALEQYEFDVAQDRYSRIELQNQQKASQRQAKEIVDAAVDSHYERVDTLLKESGIKPEIYKQADANVRLAVDTILPKQGDLITDHIISLIGEGSEKVMTYLGRNKAALNEFKSLLMDDKNGMKAAIYLGEQKQRLNNPQKQTTRAPAPSPQLGGDAANNSSNKALKKTYDKAHKAGKTQEAWNAKKAARKAGADVSKW